MSKVKLIPMVEAARNWVQIKAYELEGEKKDSLLAILNAAIEERNKLEAELAEAVGLLRRYRK